ncbi:MAG: HAD-IIA family hydrolase [Candidatus Marinimicrobia bacterium]|nr:HAD-IIA family hydrolase [Candidatus Neomarinimicrobiota bacterium]
MFMLEKIKCFLLDMDGTIYLGNSLLPGAKAFMELLAEKKIGFLFLTNNSSKHAGQYVRKLANYGISVNKKQILTSGEATGYYIKRTYPGAKIYLVGTSALQSTFLEQGIKLVEENPDLVVLGFDTTITYKKIWKICDYVRTGYPYIATHPDINCPTETGFMPDIGSFIALIKSSTGREPDIIIGKPHEQMIKAIFERTGFKGEEIAMVGDRLYTDIAMGKSGIKTILVLSGETKRGDLEGSGIIPDIIIDDLGGLVDMIKEK